MSGSIVDGKWGCDRCAANGQAKNAVATAARHNQSTGHPTWAEQTQRVTFGGVGGGAKQQGLF